MVSRRSEYALWALGVTLLAGAVHLMLGDALLAAMLGDEASAEVELALETSVGATAVVSLGLIYVRSQDGNASRVARSLARAWRFAPPIFAAAAVFVCLPAAMVEARGVSLVRFGSAVVCCSWSAALVASLPGHAILRSLALRFPPSSAIGRLQAPGARRLWQLHVDILITAASACACIAAGSTLVFVTTPTEAGEAAGSAMVLWAITVALATASGLSLGQVPGDDVVSIARRIDSLGYESPEAMAEPFVVTALDEVGELFFALEAVREHLHADMGLYQRAHDQTREADARKSDFLSAVSHELRTPLNAVGGFAQILLESPSDELSDAQREDVGLIRAGGNQLLELINDILDLSIIESGELRLTYTNCQVVEVIDEVVRIHRGVVGDRDLVLRSECGGELPAIVCDRRRLTQILTNLVSNAIKFTERGTVTLRAAYDPRAEVMVIRCSDTGVGIDDSELDGIFEEYRQAGSVKRRTMGTGLGLAIARKIAAHHGGSLTVESTLGAGSTFTLRLPLEPPSRPPAIDMATETAHRRARQSISSHDAGVGR